jgi:hypothetical protein
MSSGILYPEATWQIALISRVCIRIWPVRLKPDWLLLIRVVFPISYTVDEVSKGKVHLNWASYWIPIFNSYLFDSDNNIINCREQVGLLRFGASSCGRMSDTGSLWCALGTLRGSQLGSFWSKWRAECWGDLAWYANNSEYILNASVQVLAVSVLQLRYRDSIEFDQTICISPLPPRNDITVSNNKDSISWNNFTWAMSV